VAQLDSPDAAGRADLRRRNRRRRSRRTAAASIIAAPGLGGAAGAGLACLMVAIAVVDARRFIIPDEFNAAALALGLVDAAIPTRMTRSTPRPSRSTGFGQPILRALHGS
jgi:hypothetical protein